jgi:hypothetical protein
MSSGIDFVFITDKTIGLDGGQVNPLVSPCPVSYFFHLDEEGLSIGLITSEGIREVPSFRLNQPLLTEIRTEERAEVADLFCSNPPLDGLVVFRAAFELDFDCVQFVFHYR